MGKFWAGILTIAFLAGATNSLAAEEKVDYLRQIKPLITQRCTTCHGPVKQRGGLRLDTAAAMLKGGDSGPAIVPGEPGESPLIDAVTEAEFTSAMPAEGRPLTDAEVTLLKTWVAQGAKAPEDEVAAEAGNHWAFQVPVRTPVPVPDNPAWRRNPIDAFLAAEWEKRGLTPQPSAPKHILLRRAYLDLIGLPPTPEELRDFLADDSPQAFEKVVDRLLASPHYGERWGRHWMDVWRYSDWYGYRNELRNSVRHIWRWRDWIVESLNADKGYDRMVMEMLAGDELEPASPETLRATGFLARNYFKFNRNVWLDAAIEHTGKAFLALTISCARCHDHMYDPISQQEYYQFRAIFEPYQVRTDRIPGVADTTRNGLSLVYDADLDPVTYLFERGNDKRPDKENPLNPAVPAVLAGDRFNIQSVELPATASYPGLRPYIQQETLSAAQSQLAQSRKKQIQAETELATLQKQLAELQAEESADSPSQTEQEQPSEKPSASQPPSFVADDFSNRRPDVWEFGSGEWEYQENRLVQKAVGAEKHAITTLADHPRDFTATFRFRILGGTKYHSVGLSFDVNGSSQWDGVYLSAHRPNPKVQISHNRDERTRYASAAAGGRKSLPVQIGREHVLRVDARDRLLNVYVDDRLELIYQLPHARRSGRFSLWAFDTAAEFLHVEVSPLAEDVKLAVPDGQDTEEPQTVGDLEIAVQQAEAAREAARQQVVAAEFHLEAVEARIAADKAKYADPPSSDAADLARAAVKAQRTAALHKAEADVLQAKLELERAQHAANENNPKADKAKRKVDQAKKKLAAANKRLAEAREKMDQIDTNYDPLTDVYPSRSTGRRLALARWIADERNPLTARVAVNHIWMRHFGKPLVASVFDFGLNGKSPTHPQLLDWLAVEFLESGWSMKALHRLMVTSSAYRMRSWSDDSAAENQRIDPENHYLWRMNARRLEAEIVRDSVLAASGQLDRTFGGPELDSDLGHTTFRRSLYYRHAPEKFMTFLELFDSASTHECYRRDETVVPQQALALANSRLSIEQARRLASRLNAQVGTEDSPKVRAAFVTRLFQRVLSRLPTEQERTACQQFLIEQTQRLSDPQKLTRFEGGAEFSVAPAAEPHLRARESLVHALLNHNDFVTIR